MSALENMFKINIFIVKLAFTYKVRIKLRQLQLTFAATM